MKTPEEILKENGFSRMTVIYDKYGNQMDGDTIIEMMEEYAKEYILSLLPSDEEMKEIIIPEDEQIVVFELNGKEKVMLPKIPTIELLKKYDNALRIAVELLTKLKIMCDGKFSNGK